MDHSVTFARHYARLLWLLLHEAANVDEQKATLRALVTVSKDGAVELSAVDGQITANGAPVPGALSGVAELTGRMAAHGVSAIGFDAGAAAGGVLGTARILAGEAVEGDAGASAAARLGALNAPSVRFATRPAPQVARSVEPPPAPLAVPALATAPAAAAAVAPLGEPGALPDFGFGDVEVLDEMEVQAKLRPTPRANVAIPSKSDGHSEGGMFEQFAASRAPSSSHAELLALLDQATGANVLTRVLDDLVAIAEAAARDARPALVCEILCRITKREPQVYEFESKRAFVMALRRLAKPQVLRAITQELPHAGAQRDAFIAVLTRAGEDGADALIEQIAAMSGQNERRVYFDALLQLQSGVPTLIHMLGDARWFVARNAAELLGEMQAREAEPQLTELLRHSDDRVRRAATSALMRLGTTRAMNAIQEALKDGAPAMRMQAAAALVARKDVKTAATLVRALEEEKDDEVQAAFLLALGKLATPDAVQRLVKAAEPERGLFKKKSTAFRVAAVQGLGEARTPEAAEALKDVKTAATLVRALEEEKDDEVQAAFLLALGKLATPDAVQRLVKAAEPERGLFKKKSTAFRVAAVQGLGEARTPEAAEALKGLVSDKDDDVAASAKVAVQRIAKATAERTSD